MVTYEKIVAVFGWRDKPKSVTSTASEQATPETEEAEWFAGKDWRNVTRDQWNEHRDAVFGFAPNAFQYYFPSIICCSIESLDTWFAPADAIVAVLDRSPKVDYWDDFLIERFSNFTQPEYEIILEWLIELADSNSISTSAGLARAFDTVELLASNFNSGKV